MFRSSHFVRATVSAPQQATQNRLCESTSPGSRSSSFGWPLQRVISVFVSLGCTVNVGGHVHATIVQLGSNVAQCLSGVPESLAPLHLAVEDTVEGDKAPTERVIWLARRSFCEVPRGFVKRACHILAPTHVARASSGFRRDMATGARPNCPEGWARGNLPSRLPG
jgi:hypothetical protein